MNVDDEDVAAGAGVRIRRAEPPIRAFVTFWLENADDRGPCETALAREAAACRATLVVESRPLVHDPPPGARTAGANLVTCIRRKPGMRDADFLERWNVEHKKVALETQSTFAYVRNAVVRPLTPDAPVWDGIVEEGFPIGALTDPARLVRLQLGRGVPAPPGPHAREREGLPRPPASSSRRPCPSTFSADASATPRAQGNAQGA